MRVLRMFGMFLMAIFLCVNLSSCSEDDDEENAELAGTWGMTHDEGWEIFDGEKYEWNYNYDPKNPVDEGEQSKMVITKTGEKTYYIRYYYFGDGEWEYEEEDDMSVSVEGSVMTDLAHPAEKYNFSLNNNQLVLEYKEGGDYYEKETFIRM